MKLHEDANENNQNLGNWDKVVIDLIREVLLL